MGLPLRLDCVFCGLATGRNRRSLVRLALAALASRREAWLRLSHCGGDQHLGNDCRDGISVTKNLFDRLVRSGNPCREGFAVTTTKSTLC